jgi:hypothetical protein
MTDNNRELVVQSVSILEQAKQLIILDQESLEFVSRFLDNIRDWRARIAERLDPLIQAAHKAHKEAVALKKEAEEPLIAAEGLAKKMVGDYLEAERRLREEAERKIREAEEAKRKADTELEKAALLEQVGANDKAAELMAAAEAIEAAAPKPDPLPEKAVAPGLTTREVWRYEITDPMKLPRAYLMPDESAIGAAVRTQKARCEIAGVRIWMERVSVFSNRRA